MKNILLIIIAEIIFVQSIYIMEARGFWWNTGINVIKKIKTEKTPSQSIGNKELTRAFKQALTIGTDKVVQKLGSPNGFNSDPIIHIPLPNQLRGLKNMFSSAQMARPFDTLELKLNQAAEVATPKAKKLFLQAIKEMTFEDIKKIYKGPKDSATRYFKKKMSFELKKEMRPLVENTLTQVGAINAYEQVIGQYKNLPFVPDIKKYLTDYTLEKILDGIFYYIAQEESKIRKDPALQTTRLLKKVFGPKK